MLIPDIMRVSHEVRMKAIWAAGELCVLLASW